MEPKASETPKTTTETQQDSAKESATKKTEEKKENAEAETTKAAQIPVQIDQAKPVTAPVTKTQSEAA